MWIVLPLKALSPVKARLAQVLSPDQCEGLMQAMIEDVLVGLQDCPLVEGILIVSRDPDIPALAAAAGRVPWQRTTLYQELPNNLVSVS